MKKSLNSIDITKFVASILIFAMHCDALGDYKYVDALLKISARWCVPFFFVCSSYFLFSKSVDGKIEKSAVIKYVSRIGKLYLVWFIINLPNVYYRRLSTKDITQFGTWAVLIKNAVISSTFSGSWFLLSSIFSALLIYLLSKKLRTRTILILTSLLYVICVLSSTYDGLLPQKISRVLTFLGFPLNIFTGCFYFSIGKYIAENKDRLIGIFTKWKALGCAVFFFLVYAAEVYLTTRFGLLRTTDIAFSSAFIAFSLMLFCLQTDVEIKNGLLLRKLSTVIYCCQGNVLWVNALLRNDLDLPSLVAFLISSALVAFICTAVLLIQKHTSWRWAKYLT